MFRFLISIFIYLPILLLEYIIIGLIILPIQIIIKGLKDAIRNKRHTD